MESMLTGFWRQKQRVAQCLLWSLWLWVEGHGQGDDGTCSGDFIQFVVCEVRPWEPFTHSRASKVTLICCSVPVLGGSGKGPSLLLGPYDSCQCPASSWGPMASAYFLVAFQPAGMTVFLF